MDATLCAMTERAEPQLRYAEVRDAEAVGDYHVRCWQTAYRGLIADEIIDGMNVDDNVERWAGYFGSDPAVSGYQHVVALIDDLPVGHVSVAPCRDGEPTEDPPTVGELVVAYVDPDHQGVGIGSALLATAHRMLRLRDFATAVLWTVVGNDPAIGFYKRHGWHIDGTTREVPSNDGGPSIYELRMSIDLSDTTPHVHANRTYWDEQAPSYAAAGEHAWTSAPSWGMFSVPDSYLLGAFPDVKDRDVVELGCGTAYVSSWCARAGARSVIGIDNSRAQLATAQRLQTKHDRHFPLVWADAEHVPLADGSVDVAISEYGAAIWCDPHHWIPEAARLLRTGGTLVFLGNSVLSILAFNDFESQSATNELRRPQRDLHKLRWPDTDATEFHLSHGDMIRMLRKNSFEILDLIELYAPAGASSSHTYLDAEWASQWPHEEIWVARKI